MATQNAIDTNKPIEVSKGGTGAASLTDHSVIIGSGTGALTAIAVGATGEVLIGSTGADPSFSNTVTVTTVNATTFDTNVAAAGVTLAGTTLSADGSDADIDINITAKGTGQVIIDDLQLTTDLAVSEGGTGASTFTDHGILLGSGASAITATAAPTDGQLLIGNSGADPDLATLTAGAGMSVTNAAGSITIDNTLTTNTQADSYQLVAGDAGKMIIMTKGTANTLTIPKDATVDHPTGTQILVMQYGAGATTIAAEDGTINIRYNTDFTLTLDGQYSLVGCVKIDDNEWACGGDLTLA